MIAQSCEINVLKEVFTQISGQLQTICCLASCDMDMLEDVFTHILGKPETIC